MPAFRQWEIWKTRPPGFERDHWFVILSPQEVCDAPTTHVLNGLACWTLRGELRRMEVRLDQADGLQAPTACPCNYIYAGLEKSKLHDRLGFVSWERQQQIKAKLKEVFRL